jgi:hypothetical protein
MQLPLPAKRSAVAVIGVIAILPAQSHAQVAEQTQRATGNTGQFQRMNGLLPTPTSEATDFTQRLFDDYNAACDLKTPLFYQTGPKTSANSGCSSSIRDKHCISGRSLVSGIVGIRS